MRVYIETTIPSYLTAWPSRDIVIAGKQETTREWWSRFSEKLDLYTSEICLDESAMGDADAAGKRLDVLRKLSILEFSDEVEHLADDLVACGIIPQKFAPDALHVAFATVHGIDILLTWNCAHLANAFIMRDLNNRLREYGYEPPVICTPEEMMGEQDD